MQTPREILQTTLKSIVDGRESKSLYAIQEELVDQESKKLDKQRELDAKTEEMNKIQKQIDDLKPEVSIMTMYAFCSFFYSVAVCSHSLASNRLNVWNKETKLEGDLSYTS